VLRKPAQSKSGLSFRRNFGLVQLKAVDTAVTSWPAAVRALTAAAWAAHLTGHIELFGLEPAERCSVLRAGIGGEVVPRR